MDFSFSEEQGFIRDTIQKFIARECDREELKKLDDEGHFPDKLYTTLLQMGFCGLTVAPEHGGGGPDMVGAAMVTEDLATISPVLAGAFCASAFTGGFLISRLGSADQKSRILPEIVEGALSFAYAVEEPGLGYGDTRIQTTARKDGDGYRIKGSKKFVRYADRASHIIALAKTADNDDDSPEGARLFLIDANSDGVRSTPLEKIGFRGVSLATVELDNVSVPTEALLGAEEQPLDGRASCELVRATRHLEVSAIAVGLAQGAYDYAVAYAREREQFGQPIIRFGAVRRMLVDMYSGIQAARDTLYRACLLADEGQDFMKEAILARIDSSRLARRAGMDCMQVLGGYGYANEYDAERYLRDALTLFEGNITEEELINMLAEKLGLS